MNPALERIGACRLVPVIALADADHAAPLADALLAGGLPCAEVTFRTPAAAASIRAMSERRDLLVGAGTVLGVEQADAAIDAGAQFVVAPGLNPKVVAHCLDRGIAIAPGVATPTDIEAALGFGLEVLKFFPAEAFGGVETLKAISAPYARLKFIPTGGISEDNVARYLSLPSVLACGGSWMVPRAEIDAGRFDVVTDLVRRAVAIARNS